MTPAEILDCLDQAQEWPALDDPAVDMAAVRLHAYGDGARWALVLEVLASSTGFGPTSIHTALYSFGNCVKPGMTFVFSTDIGPALDNLTGELRPDGYVLVRGKRTPIDFSPENLERKGVRGELGDFALLLTLLPDERLFATEEELREVVPADLPQLLQLEEWNHTGAGEKPGENETFRLLAQVLATGDKGHWRPVTAPNTHWTGWR